MEPALVQTADGVRLQLRAIPKAGRDEIVGLRGGRLVVKVSAPPEDGKANAAIIKLVAKRLGVAPSQLELSGATSRDKVLLIRGVEPGAVSQALELKS